MDSRQHRRFDGPTVAAATISMLVFAYVAFRAATLCITIDEALTWNWHVSGSWLDIVLFRTKGLPDNNHVLHTLLCKLSVTLFGLSELTLRLPSLLGGLLYLFGVNRIVRQLVSGWRLVPAVLAAVTNPYVLDFFGLARGYGLGLGFTVLGLSTLLSAIAGTPGVVRASGVRIAMVLFCLAAMSNLSFLLVLGAAMLLVSLYVLWLAMNGLRPWRNCLALWLPRLAGMLLPAVPFLAYLALPMAIIRRMQLFELGGHDGFWADTVRSLVERTAYASPLLWEHLDLLTAWIMLVLMFMVPALFVLGNRSDRRKFAMLATLAAMVLLVAALSIAQHALLHVAYLEGRRGIYLIPLFLLATLAIGDPPRGTFRWYAIPAVLAGLVVPGALAVATLVSVNPTMIYDWNDYSGTRSAMAAVRERIAGSGSTVRPRTMRTNWVYEPGMNFYRRIYGLSPRLMPVARGGIDGPADFYYGYNRDGATIARYGVRLLLDQPDSGTMLWERSATAGRLQEQPGSGPKVGAKP